MGLQVRGVLVGFASLAIPFNRHRHSVQHVLVAKRLGQEIDRSALHRPDGHRNVAMAGHEDDWNLNVGLGQLGLKIQPALSGQPDVKHQAAGDIRQPALQHFGRRTEHLNLQSHRLEKIAEPSAYRRVVFNDEDDRFLRADRRMR